MAQKPVLRYGVGVLRSHCILHSLVRFARSTLLVQLNFRGSSRSLHFFFKLRSYECLMIFSCHLSRVCCEGFTSFLASCRATCSPRRLSWHYGQQVDAVHTINCAVHTIIERNWQLHVRYRRRLGPQHLQSVHICRTRKLTSGPPGSAPGLT